MVAFIGSAATCDYSDFSNRSASNILGDHAILAQIFPLRLLISNSIVRG